jgi:hypothetical protein
LGFGVWGLGFGVWGLGFGVWGLGFGVRSYKPAFSPEESIQVIETYTGTHFAPRIAEKFIYDIQNSLAAKSQLTKGSLVLLSTNELAQILQYKTNPTRTIKRGVKTSELDGDSLRVNLTKSTSL